MLAPFCGFNIPIILIGFFGIVDPSDNKTFSWFLSKIEVNNSRTAGLTLFKLLNTNINSFDAWFSSFCFFRAFDNFVSFKITSIFLFLSLVIIFYTNESSTLVDWEIIILTTSYPRSSLI